MTKSVLGRAYQSQGSPPNRRERKIACATLEHPTTTSNIQHAYFDKNTRGLDMLVDPRITVLADQLLDYVVFVAWEEGRNSGTEKTSKKVREGRQGGSMRSWSWRGVCSCKAVHLLNGRLAVSFVLSAAEVDILQVSITTENHLHQLTRFPVFS